MVTRTTLYQFACVLSALFFLSCSSEKLKTAGLYNVDSVLDKQIDYLLGHHAAITKKGVLNGVEKTTTATPDSLSWKEELGIFFELDAVNKPIYKGVYAVDDYADNKSNLSVRSFSTNTDIPVKSLKIYYQKSLSQLRKIEAQYTEANLLYSSKRLLKMQFENIYDKTILTSYTIEGGQKMFLDDSVQYTIDANIALNK